MKYLKSVILTIVCILSFSLNAQNNVIDEIIWVIGDEAILRSEVEEQRLRMQFENAAIEGDPFCVIPEEIALQKLYLNQAKIDSITESPSTVNMQVDQRINFLISQIGSKEKVEEYFGKNLVAIREELREVLEQQMIAQRMQQTIVENIKLTPAEVRDYFNKLPSEEIPLIPAKVEVQILTVEPDISVQAEEAIKAELRKFRERVESGEADFSTLAILYSEDTETAKRGGELGFVGRGMLVPEFANAAFSLSDTKKVSPIVETEYGFHIIQLIEKRGDRVNVRHILMRPKVTLSEKTKAMEKLEIIADSIRSGERSFEEAVKAHSVDKNTKMNAGLMANPATGDSKFQYSDQGLPPEIAKAVIELNIGEISQPIIITSSGKEVYAIVKVKNKIPTHTANLDEDYQDIKNLLQEQKGQDALIKWINKRQEETYIWIKEGWQDCNFKYPGWVKE
jgi:peptidyl-prolyl cis-trans isomerase SurA